MKENKGLIIRDIYILILAITLVTKQDYIIGYVIYSFVLFSTIIMLIKDLKL